MNWQNLFLSANGRIGQKDFWIGFLILFVVGMILGLIPVLGLLVSIALIYPWACLFSKRLHDFGKTGWLFLAPFVINMVLGVVAAVVGGGAAALGGGNTGAGLGAMFATMGIFLLIMAVVNIGFLLWVGLSKSDPGTNKYGAPPTSMIGGAATV